MPYITTEDLKAFLDEREIAAIKRDYEIDGTDKMPVGITYAENYVKDRLGSRFNMPSEYSKTGTNRSSTLLEIIAHLAIWKLTSTFPTVQLDGKRHYFYEQALKRLDDIATGKLEIGLPELAVPSTAGDVVYGHNDNLEILY